MFHLVKRSPCSFQEMKKLMNIIRDQKDTAKDGRSGFGYNDKVDACEQQCTAVSGALNDLTIAESTPASEFNRPSI
jgi:hypothetical protein